MPCLKHEHVCIDWLKAAGEGKQSWQFRYFITNRKILNFVDNRLVIVAKERDLADPIFGIRNFVRTLSYREFISSLSLALLLLALFRILDYYSNEHWIENHDVFIKCTLFCVVLPVSHVFYKIEHKRPNNFIGRNLHDHIVLLLFIGLSKIQLLFMGASLSFAMEDVGKVIVGLLVLIILVVLLELTIAIVKRMLRLFRWQVL